MKFSLLLSQTKKNKEQSDRELEEIQKERQKVETKVHELEVQQNNLQELLLSIKVILEYIVSVVIIVGGARYGWQGNGMAL